MRFIMPTLADSYMYEGLSGETYPDRKAGAVKGVYQVSDLSLTPYLVPQDCGMHMDTDWLEVTRYTSLDNSRRDYSLQILKLKKTDEPFAFFPAFHIQQKRLKTQHTMKNCRRQEGLFCAFVAQ